MFRVIVLGSGGSIPTIERGLPSLAIRAEGKLLLFDCGEGTQRQMMRFNVSYGKTSDIFLTHLHADHVIGIIGLTQTLEMNERKDPLVIHGPKGTKDFISYLLGAYKLPGYPIFIEEMDGKVDFGKFVVTSYKTQHGNSCGYIIEEKEKIKFNEKKAKKMGIEGIMFKKIQKDGKIELFGKKIVLEEISYKEKGKKIVYTGDTIPCQETIDAAQNADLLIHDGTFGNELENEAKLRLHSTAKGAAEIAKIANVDKLVLAHVSNRYKNAEDLLNQAKSIFSNTFIAYDGMEIHL